MKSTKLSDAYKKHKSKLRRAAQIIAPIIAILLVIYAFRHVHLHQALLQIEHANRWLLLLALLAMAVSMLARTISWLFVLKETFKEPISLGVTFNAIAIGVFLSATSPLRLGEVARALVLSRHTDSPVKNLPRIAGTILSQTLMNILALIILGASLVVIASTHFNFAALKNGIIISLVIVLIAGISILVALRQRHVEFLKESIKHFISGFQVFKSPLPTTIAVLFQLLAWGLQTVSCYLLLMALHIHTSNNLCAAAAVLFAVNVTAIIPITPSNIGPFQAACVAILSGLFSVSTSQAIAYGIQLQLVEVVTAIILGLYALQREGLSRQKLLLESRSSRIN